MDDMTRFEERFEDRLRAFARTGVQSVDSAAVARTVAIGHPRSTRPARRRLLDEIHRIRQRAVFGTWRTRSMFKTALGAAAVIAVVISGAALLLSRPAQPAIGGPSVAPGASQPAVVGPSVMPTGTPSPTPSPTPTPLLWTLESLHEDWPAPVRSEPVGEVIVLPFEYDSRATIVPDPLGDTGSDAHPWVDIRQLQGSGAKFSIELVDNHPPLVDPTEQWIAYGVVVDDDRDGIPDWRYGIDNLPVDPSGWAANPDSERMAREQLARGSAPHRAWRTDLHTGRTEAAAGPPYGDTFYPPGGGEPSGARFGFGGDIAGGGTDPGLVDPFYAWASVIVDGRVVATDYAPDVGWLDPSKAKP